VVLNEVLVSRIDAPTVFWLWVDVPGSSLNIEWWSLVHLCSNDQELVVAPLSWPWKKMQTTHTDKHNNHLQVEVIIYGIHQNLITCDFLRSNEQGTISKQQKLNKVSGARTW
jgi:hypothetical protein